MTIIIRAAKIIGGVMAIQPEFERFEHCYFECTEISMERQQNNVFIACYFKDCVFDEGAKLSVRTGNNFIKDAPVVDAEWPKMPETFITSLGGLTLSNHKMQCPVHGVIQDGWMQFNIGSIESPMYCMRCALDVFAKQGISVVTAVAAGDKP